MKISVIVPTFNAERTIEKCLNALKKQTYKNFEVIVVDGSSTDNTVKVIEGKFDAKLKRWRSSGPGEKRNVGAKMAKGEILLFLDSDLALCKDGVKELVKVFEKVDADGITGTPFTPKDSGTLDYIVGLDYEYRFEKMGESFVDVAATTIFAIKKKVFFKIGGFDVRFKRATGEDWDFSAKMRKKGFTIFHTQKVKGYHYTAERVCPYLKKQYHHAKYRVEHAMEHKQTADQYTKPYMIIQSFLWLLMLFFIFSPPLFILIFLITILWNMPEAIELYRRTGDARLLLLIPLSSVRSIYWLAGAIVGFIELLGGRKD